MFEDFRKKGLSDCLEMIVSKKMSWVAKRLTGNDTGLTRANQAGVYLPKEFFRHVIPEIHTTSEYNPRVSIECEFPFNDAGRAKLSAIYYNSKYFPERELKKKQNEFRITGWGGKSSPAQAADNTGSIFIFAVRRDDEGLKAIAIVSESAADEDLIQEWLGCDVDPSSFILSKINADSLTSLNNLPEKWYQEFPTGAEIFAHVKNILPWGKNNWTADTLLLARRKLEFDIFSKIEKEHILPQIEGGFEDVETYIAHALSVANRRKSRTGNSLEMNLASVFMSEKISFDSQQTTENKKKPDFIFPSIESYRNPIFENGRLTMLAAKTCCKDRWRQVLSEADKIEHKHLFTLQEGVSSNQLDEMASKQLTLVVPKPNLTSFPDDWRGKIMTLSSFIDAVRAKQIY